MKNDNVVSSFAFKFFERIVVKGLGLAISIVLARLIAPEVYGLLAIIMVAITFAQAFVQSGLATALVQNKETCEEDYSTVYWISFAIAIFANIVLYFVAPIVATIYKSKELIWPLRVLSSSLLLSAYNSVQTAKMQREMRFKAMMCCNIVATLISGAVGIYAAIQGLELWALVIYTVMHTVVVILAMSISDRWYPKLYFSVQRAKILYGFGWKLLVSSLLTTLYNEIRTLIIGYRYSNTDLAYYNRGQQFPTIIASTMDASLQSVMLPVMSSKQEKKEELAELLMQTLSISTFFITPVMLGLAAISTTLIPLLLGEAWLACVPLLCVFCVSELMTPILSSNLSVLKASGRSDLYMRTEIIRRTIMLVILGITVFFFDSVLAITIGYALSSWIDTYIIACAVNMQINCSWKKQIGCVWKSLLSGLLMFCVVYCMNGIQMSLLPRLMLQIVIGALIYIAISIGIGNKAYCQILQRMRKCFTIKNTV